MRTIIFVALTLLVLTTGCQLFGSGGTTGKASVCEPPLLGADTHCFTAFDANDEPVLQGTLQLHFGTGGDDDAISGAWALSRPPAGGVNPLLEENGQLVGSIRDQGEVWIHFTPQVADAGVFALLRFTGDAEGDLEGTWGTITIIGSTDQGRFVAIRP